MLNFFPILLPTKKKNNELEEVALKNFIKFKIKCLCQYMQVCASMILYFRSTFRMMLVRIFLGLKAFKPSTVRHP